MEDGLLGRIQDKIKARFADEEAYATNELV
jgi:hypothetical protein